MKTIEKVRAEKAERMKMPHPEWITDEQWINFLNDNDILVILRYILPVFVRR